MYGVWDYFAAFRVWPKELREPLRAGLKARNKGQWEYSAAKFREALRIAHTLDDATIGSDRLLKTTGIAIALASVLEEDEKWQEAALVYVDALDEVLQRSESRSPPEKMRGVALAQKVGELAQRSDVLVPPCPVADSDACQTSEPAEGYLAWSVEEMLRLVQAPRSEGPVLLADLDLPAWVSAQDLGASVEALGAFYASHQQADLAVPLYLQAIATLLPPQAQGRPPPTVADRCRAAILMNNISQALTQTRTDTETLLKAMAWATKGLDLATLTSYRAGFLTALPPDERALLLQISGHDPHSVAPVAPVVETASEARLEQVKQQCLGTQFVLLYNLGMFYSMHNDKETARILFQRAMRQAEFLQLREARTQCARALKRLERA